MNDDTLKWAIPALSLGYTIKDDPCGRLEFFNDSCVIIYRDGWKLIDPTGAQYEFESLEEVLQSGADY